MSKSEELNIVLKEVLSATTVASSSDLIVALYQIFVKMEDARALVLDPIYRWEYENYHDSWESNVNFIEKKLHDLDELDYIELEMSYLGVIEFFIGNKFLSKTYCMDETDELGWKIFRELRDKRDLVKKHSIISNYKRERNETV